jgi:hypothetical protein
VKEENNIHNTKIMIVKIMVFIIEDDDNGNQDRLMIIIRKARE